jgi:hypothetical protein
MIQLIVTDFIPLTLVEQFHKRNLIKFVLTDTMLPEWTPIRLQTNSFWLILPELTRKFPNHTINVEFQSSDIPIINYVSDGVMINTKLIMRWIGYEENSQTPKPLFTSLCIVTCKGTAKFQNLKIIPSLTYLYQDNSLIETNIGNFDIKVIDNFMNVAYNRGFIPLVNNIIALGLPIPSIPHLTIINPQVNF